MRSIVHIKTSKREPVVGRVAIMLGVLAGCGCGFASNPGHTAWTVLDGFSLSSPYAVAQPVDGYLWLGTEIGLFRVDDVRSVPWQPPAGQQLPDEKIYSLTTRP